MYNMTSAISDFTKDDKDYRQDNSLCKSPRGRVAVRNGLLGFSFAVSLVIFFSWLGCLVYVIVKRWILKPGKPTVRYV